MTPEEKKQESIKIYREITKGLSGKDLHKAITDFRSGKYTNHLY